MAIKISKTEWREFEQICELLHLKPEWFNPVGNTRREWSGRVAVGPVLAQYLLDNFNPKTKEFRNRERKIRAGQRYEKDMAEDRWEEKTHESIAFGWLFDLFLMDGQNRLWGVIDSGVKIVFLIHIGLPREAMTAVDQGVGRNAVDGAHIAGRDDVTLRRCATISAGFADCGCYPNLSNGQKRDLCEVYGKDLDFVEEHLGSRSDGITQLATFRGVIFRAHAWICSTSRGDERDEQLTRLAGFCEVVLTGGYQGNGDSAAICLRNKLDKLYRQKRTRNGDDRRLMYLLTEAAIEAFLEKKPRKKLSPAKEELFPIKES